MSQSATKHFLHQSWGMLHRKECADSELRAKENHVNVQPVICFFWCRLFCIFEHSVSSPFSSTAHLPTGCHETGFGIRRNKSWLQSMIRKTNDFKMVLKEGGKHKKILYFILLSVSYGLACLYFWLRGVKWGLMNWFWKVPMILLTYVLQDYWHVWPGACAQNRSSFLN